MRHVGTGVSQGLQSAAKSGLLPLEVLNNYPGLGASGWEMEQTVCHPNTAASPPHRQVSLLPTGGQAGSQQRCLCVAAAHSVDVRPEPLPLKAFTDPDLVSVPTFQLVLLVVDNLLLDKIQTRRVNGGWWVPLEVFSYPFHFFSLQFSYRKCRIPQI